MKNKLLFPFSGLLLVGLALQSCINPYGPAYLGSSNAYQAKPAFRGQRANTFCLNGRANKGVVYHAGEKNNSYEFSGHVSFMRRYFYYSGGLFGYWGQYWIDAAPGSPVGPAPYKVRGFGTRHEIGGRIPLHDFDLLLGLGLQNFKESGEFIARTADESENSGIASDFNLDFRYAPLAKNYALGLRFSNGTAHTGLFDNQMSLHQLTLHGTLGRVTAYGQIGFGHYPKSAYQIQGSLFHAGLSYALPFGRRKTPTN